MKTKPVKKRRRDVFKARETARKSNKFLKEMTTVKAVVSPSEILRQERMFTNVTDTPREQAIEILEEMLTPEDPVLDAMVDNALGTTRHLTNKSVATLLVDALRKAK